MVEGEGELLPAGDTGAGIGDDPLEARVGERTYSPVLLNPEKTHMLR